jgi:hypothetical protein
MTSITTVHGRAGGLEALFRQTAFAFEMDRRTGGFEVYGYADRYRKPVHRRIGGSEDQPP